MIKTAVVQDGRTPSSFSGKPCVGVDENGEPIACDTEKQACVVNLEQEVSDDKGLD